MTMQSDVHTALKFIHLMKNASLGDSGLSVADIYYLQHPRSRSLPDLTTDRGLKLCFVFKPHNCCSKLSRNNTIEK